MFIKLSSQPERTFYVVEENEEFLFVCTALCYEWMKQNNQLERLKEINLDGIIKRNNEIIYLKNFTPIITKSWVLNFPFGNIHYRNINFATEVFERYMLYQEIFFTQRLEQILNEMKFFLSDEMIKQTFLFILENEKEEKIDRVKLLVSSLLEPYIEKHKLFI